MMLEFLVWDCQPMGAHCALEVGTKTLRFAALHIFVELSGPIN